MKNFKYAIATIFCGLFFFANNPDLKADHIFGGQMSYVYIGNNQYQFVLQLYRAETGIPLPGFINLNIRKPSGQLINEFGQVSNGDIDVDLLVSDFITINNDPCFVDAPDVSVELGIYRLTITLPDDDPGVYELYYQTCCRNEEIVNISNPLGAGSTFAIDIPHNIIDPPNDINNTSAVFIEDPPLLVCLGSPFIYDHSAFDADGDSLVYGLYTPFEWNNYPNFGTVNWIPPFNVNNQMGGSPALEIDSETGLLTANPDSPGQYVVGVYVEEWRDGLLLCTNRRDYQFNVTECDQVQVSTGTAQEEIDLIGVGDYEVNSCTSLTYVFEETSPGSNSDPSVGIEWLGMEDIPGLLFTDAIGGAFDPQVSFPGNGTYELQFTAGTGVCRDTATVTFNMFLPNANFEIPNGECGENTIEFSNMSIGAPDSILWDFGDQFAAANDNQSDEENPAHTYSQEGTYYVTLNTFTNGCIGEKIDSVIIAPPFSTSLLADVNSICQGDPVVLEGDTIGGDGSFLSIEWLPNDVVINTNDNGLTGTLTPMADTWIYFKAETATGCESIDSVFVEVLDVPEINLPAELGLCGGADTPIEANVTGNYTTLTWSPTTDLVNENTLTPTANPTDPTTYTLTVENTICQSTASVNLVPVGPVSVDLLNQDQTICEGTEVTLEAQSTETVTWIGEGIDNSNALVQTITPTSTGTYEVMVANNCFDDSKTVTITVDEQPILDAGPDISLGFDESGSLQGTTNLPIVWTPSTGLTDPTDPNTVAKPSQTTVYTMTAVNGECSADDFMKVTVSADISMNVPTAFTPNGDGLNDVVNFTTNGIESVESFDVYNRWGEHVYSGNGLDAAWDGFYQSEVQPVGVYVYYIVAVTVFGDELVQPGHVTLIR